MKCLSISQPFADLIILGKKTIELRNWNTNFRGEFLIHVPLKIKTDDCKRLKINKKFTTGVIIGKAELYDVKKYNSLRPFLNGKFVNSININGTIHYPENYETFNIDSFFCPICSAQDKARLYAYYINKFEIYNGDRCSWINLNESAIFDEVIGVTAG